MRSERGSRGHMHAFMLTDTLRGVVCACLQTHTQTAIASERSFMQFLTLTRARAHTHANTHTQTKPQRKCRSSMGQWKLEAVFFPAVDTHQFQGNCSPHYWKMLPECQLRGKFLTSHHTNKQCTPLPLIKGGVSADRESGGGRGKGRRHGVSEVGME